jgi:predicted oxidoreductase
MSEERGREVLSQLQVVLAANAHPSVREAGLTEAEARWLVSKELLSLGDTLTWNKSKQETTEFVDRYEIHEISDAAIAWLAAHPTPPKPIVVCIEAQEVSIFSKIFRWLMKTMWAWISIAVTTAIGFIVYYLLKKHFHDS